MGGVISYDNSVKSLLGVKPEDLAQLGAVSATGRANGSWGTDAPLHHLGTKLLLALLDLVVVLLISLWVWYICGIATNNAVQVFSIDLVKHAVGR